MHSVFTAQQFQVLSALIKKNATNNVMSQTPTQANQVASFTVDTKHKDSPTGNAIISNLYTTIKGSSLQKNVYIVAVLIWRLLNTATIFCIIRQFNNRQNSPSNCVI